SLGLGPVSLADGVLQAVNNVTLANTLTLAGGPVPVVLAGSNMTIANPAVLGGNVNLSVNNTTTFNADLATSPFIVPFGTTGTSSLTLTNQAVVTGSATYTGAGGNLVIATPVSYSGTTAVNAGTLTLSGNGALAQTANASTV